MAATVEAAAQEHALSSQKSEEQVEAMQQEIEDLRAKLVTGQWYLWLLSI